MRAGIMNLNGLLTAVRVFAIAVFCLSGLILVKGDIANQKILNRQLLICASLALGAYAVLGLHSILSSASAQSGYLLGSFYRAVALHLGVSAAAALIIWECRMWPAGDAKLFLFLSLLLPLATVPEWFDPWRESLISLINIFVPAAVVLVARAAVVVWKLYLQNQARFLLRLGWRRLPDYLFQGKRALADSAAGALRKVRGFAADPARSIAGLLLWVSSMALTTAVAFRLQTIMTSTILVSGVTFLVLLVAQKATRRWGRTWAVVGTFGAVYALFYHVGPAEWAQSARLFASVSVFSFSIQWGFSLARRLLEERGLIYAPLLGLLTWALPMFSMSVFGATPLTRTLLTWSVLGLFFGLGNLMVRILEEQDRPILSPSQLRPYVVLAPDFVDLLSQDEEFFEEHIGSLYADGLTSGQVDAVRNWCERNRVERVPLSETVSFAFWIFLGFGLTVVLRGHVLSILY